MDDTEEIDPSVKKITTDGDSVERFDPGAVDEHNDRVAATKAMKRPGRGMVLSKIRHPRATGN